jgi:hypothetical protein
MAKTVKVGNEYYNEGVKVPAPKKKATTVKKSVAKKKDPIKEAYANAKARQKRWGNK